jgi:hypothetical protein
MSRLKLVAFFTQCPSFLEPQKLMKKKKGKDNAQEK